MSSEPPQPPPVLDYERQSQRHRPALGGLTVARRGDAISIVTPYRGRLGHWTWFGCLPVIAAYFVLFVVSSRIPLPWLPSLTWLPLLVFFGLPIAAMMIARAHGTRTVLEADATGIYQLIHGRFRMRRSTSNSWTRDQITGLSVGPSLADPNEFVLLLHLAKDQTHVLLVWPCRDDAEKAAEALRAVLHLPVAESPTVLPRTTATSASANGSTSGN